MTVPEDKLAGKITNREVKRVNYFDTQFLQEADFQDEQAYQIRLRRANNLATHGWGIVAGLEIEQTGANEFTVKPGMAIDKFGREIVLAGDSPIRSYDLSGFNIGDVVFLTIAYDTDTDEKDRNPSGDTNKFIRTIERPKLEKSTTLINDGTAIVLGKAATTTTGGASIDIDLSIRQIARSQSSPIVGTAANGKNILAPDGNPANWVIFVSLHKIEAPSKIIAQLEISTQPTPTGWVINCSGTDSADVPLSGEANYMILRRFNN